MDFGLLLCHNQFANTVVLAAVRLVRLCGNKKEAVGHNNNKDVQMGFEKRKSHDPTRDQLVDLP